MSIRKGQNMEIFKDGRTAFAVIPKKDAKKVEALKIANKHFKTATEKLEVRTGYVEGNALYLGGKADMWIVTRREKA